MFCLCVPLRDLTGFNFCTVQVRATRLRDLYAKVGCSYIPRLQGLDTRGGGPHFPLVYMEKPRPRETAQPLSPTPGQRQTSPELHCTKMLLLCSSRNSTNSLRFKNFLSNKYILYFPQTHFSLPSHRKHSIISSNISTRKLHRRSKDSYSFPTCNYLQLFILMLNFSCLERKPGLHFSGPGWHFASFSYNIEESNYTLSKNKTRRLSLAQRNL